jgi:hypothetical protein
MIMAKETRVTANVAEQVKRLARFQAAKTENWRENAMAEMELI